MRRTVTVPVISPLPWQRLLLHAFRRFPDARILTGVTGRQCGKTEGAVLDHGIASLNCPDGWNQIITPTYPLGLPMYSRLKAWAMPPRKAPLAAHNDSRRTLAWVHGPMTECRTLYPRPGDVVGNTTRAIMNVDEAGRVTEEGWTYLQPMLRRWDARQVRTGTPRGKTGGKGGFYDGYQRGLDRQGRSPLVSGEPPRDKRYLSLRVPCHPSIAPWWTEEAIAEARESMPERLFQQEILALFVEGSGDVFTKELLQAACILSPAEPEEGTAYGLGWDPARSSDPSALSVVKMRKPVEEVALYAWENRPWQAQLADVKAISQRFNHATVAIDATGIGAVVAEALEEMGVDVVRYVITGGDRATEATREGGSGSVSKSQLVENLLAMMGAHVFKLLARAEDPVAYQELLDFQMELNVQQTELGVVTGHMDIKYGHPEGGHDDTVMARALAAWLARHGYGIPVA